MDGLDLAQQASHRDKEEPEAQRERYGPQPPPMISHSGFHADIRGYIEGVFTIAGEDPFPLPETLKTERGLVDYEDMEQLALSALDEPAVAERLREEVELLLVDEFQDTNPMQLALFMKLARLAQEVCVRRRREAGHLRFPGKRPDSCEARSMRSLPRQQARRAR